MSNQTRQIDLGKLFQTVAGTMAENKQQLNKADTYNHDHGDNMVEVFNVISQAMQEKKDADPADQLAYASQLLRQRKSGSAQVYAQGLSQASKEFKGQSQVTTADAMKLIQSLLGGGQAASGQPLGGVGDLLGTLLGGASGAATSAQGQQTPGGLDVGDLLNAGMAFMDTKSKGGSTMEAIVNALVSGSAMADSAHRSQSGALVVNSLLQAISGMAAKK
jgi:hypothetical protein